MENAAQGWEPNGRRAEWARFYCEHGMALVPIPAGRKGPVTEGWNQPGGYFTNAALAEAHWRKHPQRNMGAVLGPSQMVTFDGDHLEWSRMALAAVGLALDAFLAVGAGLEGNPAKAKRVFSVPVGCDLPFHKLIWPHPENPDDAVTVFELRAGPVQDVLPPSIHPDTRKPYRWLEGHAPWKTGGLPPLPDWLERFWRRWDDLLPLLEAACPWRTEPPRLLCRPRESGDCAEGWDAVREELRLRMDLEAVLEGMGAERRGRRNYLCPFHAERSPSFWVYDGGRGYPRWICAHGNAPVGVRTSRGWSCGDVLDLIAHERGMTVGKVTVELARQMDIALPKGSVGSADAALPEPPPETRQECGVVAVPAEAKPDMEPMPLPFHEVESFPVRALPGSLRRFVEEVAAALPCPPDFVGVPLLAVAGAAIGTSREVLVKESWREGARLYTGVVADPGSKKSPALSHVMRPVLQRQRVLKAEYDATKAEHLRDVAQYEQDLAAWREGVKRGAKGGPAAGEMPCKPDAPAMPQLVITDSTLEAQVQLMAQNPRGLLLYRDELAGWVRGMDAYRSGKGSDLQAWLSFWSGEPYTVNRKSDPEPVVLNNPFVCVTGCLPPDVLGELSDERGRQDGFIHRVLLTFPDHVPLAWSEAVVAAETLREYGLVLERLWTLRPEPDGTPLLLHLAPGAKAVWVEWIEEHFAEMNAPLFSPALRGPWAKLEGYCARLALILHLCRRVCGEADGEDVDAESMLGAVALVEYFKSHNRRVYARLRATDEDQEVMQALLWVQKQGRPVTARDVQRSCVAGVRTADDAARLMRKLEKRGYGTLREGQKHSLTFILTAAPDT